MPDRIRVKVLEPVDSEALLAMVGHCSAMSLYRRFHGVGDDVRHAQQVLAAAAGHDSYAAWRGGRCVGLGNLHAYGDTAEIGVLVEDRWRRRGVGTALVVAFVRQARERRSPFLRADLLADDHFALPAPAIVRLSRTWSAHGTYTRLIDLGLGTAPVQTPSVTTPSEIPPVRSVDEAVGTATTPSGLEGLR
jgi:GNAT superfamily N-acetyltransferase